MRGLNIFGCLEIGDGARDFEDVGVGAGAEADLIDCDPQQFLARFSDHAAALDVSGACCALEWMPRLTNRSS